MILNSGNTKLQLAQNDRSGIITASHASTGTPLGTARYSGVGIGGEDWTVRPAPQFTVPAQSAPDKHAAISVLITLTTALLDTLDDNHPQRGNEPAMSDTTSYYGPAITRD